MGFYNGRVYVIDTVRRMKLKPFGHHVGRGSGARVGLGVLKSTRKTLR